MKKKRKIKGFFKLIYKDHQNDFEKLHQKIKVHD
jgi:hypothetical protein